MLIKSKDEFYPPFSWVLGTKKLPGKVYTFMDVWTHWILKTRECQVISIEFRSRSSMGI